jgi:hypothetical protein
VSLPGVTRQFRLPVLGILEVAAEFIRAVAGATAMTFLH